MVSVISSYWVKLVAGQAKTMNEIGTGFGKFGGGVRLSGH
jgi:hypothetical protein